MTEVLILSKYNRKKLFAGKTFTRPTLTQQHFKDDCDVNVIMDRYACTGVMESGTRQPIFDDFSVKFNYQRALDRMIEAEDRFMALPAKVRERFANDPAKLLQFLADEKNRPEAESLGLVTPKPKADPPPLVEKDPPEQLPT